MKRTSLLKPLGLLFIVIGLLSHPLIIGKVYTFSGELPLVYKIKLYYCAAHLMIFGFFLLFFKKIPVNLKLLYASILLALALIEIILRIHPLLVSQQFANQVLSKNRTGKAGIYEHDFHLKMPFLKPNFETNNYFNGYRWRHKTDSRGFRNPREFESANVILLGDSFIFGHGVQEHQSVRHFLDESTPLTVMNLARSGDAAYQYLYLLTHVGQRMNPQYAFYFYYENDLPDMIKFQSQEQMAEFINTPFDKIHIPKRVKKEATITTLIFTHFGALVLDNFHFPQALRIMNHKLIGKLCGLLGLGADFSHQMNVGAHEEGSLEWEYTKKAVLYLNQLAQKNGITFVISVIPVEIEQNNQFEILENLARKNNIPFLDTRSMLGQEKYFLPGDGHFSEEGNKKLAKMMVEYLKRERAFPF